MHALMEVERTYLRQDVPEFRAGDTVRVQVRVKAPDANKVKLNFWSGPKVDMEKQADGYWTVTTTPLVPGLHYYVINVDGLDASDPDSKTYFGGNRYVSARPAARPSAKANNPTTRCIATFMPAHNRPRS